MLLITVATQAQTFYGGGTFGTTYCTVYDAHAKQEKQDFSSIYVSGVGGYRYNLNRDNTIGIIGEVQGYWSDNGICFSPTAGIAYDLSKSVGVHLTAGVSDYFASDLIAPIKIVESVHFTGTAKVWINKTLIQVSYQNPYGINNTLIIGAGMIGLLNF